MSQEITKYINITCTKCKSNLIQRINLETDDESCFTDEAEFLEDEMLIQNILLCRHCKTVLTENINIDLGRGTIPSPHEDEKVDEWIKDFFSLYHININNKVNPLFNYLFLLVDIDLHVKSETGSKINQAYKTFIDTIISIIPKLKDTSKK